jgi:hypothetical protein
LNARPGKKGARGHRGLFSSVIRNTLFLVLLTALPFVTLVRGSVFLFHRFPISGWVALAGGALATLGLLILYLVFVSIRMGKKGRVPKVLMKGTAALVGAYCLYTLLFLSGANAKTDEIRDTYTSLNPILRVAVSTLLLVDRDGVLTDTGRTREDYQAWGMEVNEGSLHIAQADGFVYAVDIRTVGRGERRNAGAAAFFRVMGFKTIRHVGTADHLHVSLLPNATSTRVGKTNY